MKKLTHKKLAQALLEATQGATPKEQTEMVKTFVAYLARQGKLSQGEKIVSALEELIEQQEGYRNYEVTTVEPLGTEQKKQLQQTLGEKARFVEQNDPNILGGMILKTKNMIYDGSLKTALAQLKHHLNH